MNLTGKGGINYSLAAKPIKSGGEGEIYDINGNPGHGGSAGNPNFFADSIVAKIYKPGKATSEKERKLIKMVAFPPDASVLAQIAWPRDVLYDDGRFAGFIMPKMNVNEELNVIYEYGASAKYPLLTWANKITIAQNLCAVLYSIHESGHVCGDLNPKNISVNPGTGHIIFLDTDSYHILDGKSTYRCDVGIPEYLPPEVQQKMRGGTNLATASLPTFTEYTDCFALAVHIFQLLMNGVHPFACAIIPSQSSVVAPQPADGILRGDCPFLESIPGVRIPAYAPDIGILPEEIALLFESAFAIGHSNPAARPAPIEWHGALKNLRGSLRLCGAVPHHQYFSELAYCPWCEVDKKFKKLSAPQKAIAQTGYEPVAMAPPVGGAMPAGGANTAMGAAPPAGANAPKGVQSQSGAGSLPFHAAKPFAQSNSTTGSLAASHQGAAMSFNERLEEQIKSGVFFLGSFFKIVLLVCSVILGQILFGSGSLVIIVPISFIPLLFLFWLSTSAANSNKLANILTAYRIYIFICAFIAVGGSFLLMGTGLDYTMGWLLSLNFLVLGVMLFIYFACALIIIGSMKYSVEHNVDFLALNVEEKNVTRLSIFTAIIPICALIFFLFFGHRFGEFSFIPLIVSVFILSNIPLVLIVRRLYYSHEQ